MAASEQEVMARARKIFEAEHPGDRRWGTVTSRGRLAIRMEINEGPGSPPVQILTEAERAPYIERAREELANEAAT